MQIACQTRNQCVDTTQPLCGVGIGSIVDFGRSADEEDVMSETYRGSVRAPEFPVGAEWFNVERALTMADLRGKLVLLDFWTYC